MKNLNKIGNDLKNLKDKKSVLEAQIKTLNKEIDDVERELIDSMIESEINNFSNDQCKFIITTQKYPSYLKENEQKLFRTLKENNYDGLIKETVHPSTFKSFIKEILGEDDSLPDFLHGLVNVYEKTSIRINRK